MDTCPALGGVYACYIALVSCHPAVPSPAGFWALLLFPDISYHKFDAWSRKPPNSWETDVVPFCGTWQIQQGTKDESRWEV